MKSADARIGPVHAIALDADNTLFLRPFGSKLENGKADPVAGTGSEELKDEAWLQLFGRPAGRLPHSTVAEVLAEVNQKIKGGKGDRKDVVRALLEVSGLTISEQNINNYCESFSRAVLDSIIELGLPNSVVEALQTIKNASRQLYIVTATPKYAAETTLKKLDVYEYFTGVYGRPKNKRENLVEALHLSGVKAEQFLVVDDTPEVLEMAKDELGMKVVGVRTKRVRLWHGDANPGFPLINSIAELPSPLGIT